MCGRIDQERLTAELRKSLKLEMKYKAVQKGANSWKEHMR